MIAEDKSTIFYGLEYSLLTFSLQIKFIFVGEMETESLQAPRSSPESDQRTLGKYQKLFDKIHHYSSVSFVLMLAKDVGILDTLLAADKSMTSQEIADSRNLKER